MASIPPNKCPGSVEPDQTRRDDFYLFPYDLGIFDDQMDVLFFGLDFDTIRFDRYQKIKRRLVLAELMVVSTNISKPENRQKEIKMIAGTFEQICTTSLCIVGGLILLFVAGLFLSAFADVMERHINGGEE